MNLPPSSPLKAFLDRRLPWLYRPIRSAWQRAKQRRFERRYRRLVDAILAKGGRQVRTGPFAGMNYVDQARSSALLPKLIGTYEDELHVDLEEMLRKPYSAIVDIGCAEGYYAVGLARRLPSAVVYAYDQDAVARELCERMAAQNGVTERVVIRDRFTPDRFGELPRGRVLAICDVDGFETELFVDAAKPYWATVDLIVELHDYLGAACREPVMRCLTGTHRMKRVKSRPKTPPSIESLEGLEDSDRFLAVDEIRAPQEWLIALSTCDETEPQE